MKRLICVLALSLLVGCAGLQSKETVAVCKAVDTVTTIALVSGGATELNPIMGGLLAHGYLPFVAAQAGIVWLIWHYWDEMSDTSQKVVTGVACLPAAINVGGGL